VVESVTMKANRSVPSATVIPVLIYPDVRAAVEGHRAQLQVGAGAVIVGDVHGDRRAPLPEGASHSVMVRVEDIDAHCAHAREHGARIVTEPTDFECGERQYTATDLAGHRWTFSETLADRAPEDWGGKSIAP
jgi:uncharacterized glyoxalase superfamily protein PhnB